MESLKSKVLYEKYSANGLTPTSVFELLSGKKKFLLESTVRHEEKGKYSFIGVDPYEEIIGRDGKTVVRNLQTGQKENIDEDALSYMKKNLPRIETDASIPFFGGAVGYVGYDVALDLMNLEQITFNKNEMPAIHFMLYKDIIVFDHRDDSIYFVAVKIGKRTEEELEKRIENLKGQIRKRNTNKPQTFSRLSFYPEIDEELFKEKVRRVKTYIEKGEVEQVVLSQRMKADIPKNPQFPFSFYQSLRESNPSPYMFYVDFEEYLILGASPESIVQVKEDYVVTNPIAGTRPRGTTKEADQLLEKELLQDEKEVLEHEMLVELSKDDFSLICEEDSITVPTSMKIERYEHVMHMVSEVQGKLRKGFTSIDALLANFPAGTVSGAPRKRAIEIIHALEENKRGAYGGGIGYINFNGDLNIALTIRSLIMKDDIAYLQAGAGIVADSNPEKEYEETLNKAKSIQKMKR